MSPFLHDREFMFYGRGVQPAHHVQCIYNTDIVNISYNVDINRMFVRIVCNSISHAVRYDNVGMNELTTCTY